MLHTRLLCVTKTGAISSKWIICDLPHDLYQKTNKQNKNKKKKKKKKKEVT